MEDRASEDAKSLSQHDEKHVVPTPLNGISVGKRSFLQYAAHVMRGLAHRKAPSSAPLPVSWQGPAPARRSGHGAFRGDARGSQARLRDPPKSSTSLKLGT
jgi:hypothetical protein